MKAGNSSIARHFFFHLSVRRRLQYPIAKLVFGTGISEKPE
jgi:hypothetical protein